jgi:PAS domain S-box-containing protein
MAADVSHLTSLFENATEGIILTNGSGNIALVNPAAERLFGYRSDELVNQPIEVLIPERFKPNHKELREGFYKHPSNRVMGHGRDLYGRTKDGTDIPLEVSLSHYKKGDELFVIAFIVDIAARKEAENNMLKQQKELEKISNEVRQLNTELEAKVEERTLILKEALQKLEQSQLELSEALDKERELNEIKSRFVSMASHEFRTPLSTVLSSASLLSRYTLSEEQDKRNKHINKIKESVKHLNNILEDFLSLGKLNEGRVGTSFAPFDLKEIIDDTIEETKSILKKGQHINCSYEGVPDANTDKKLLKNILINLIGNAIKFSPEGMPIEVRSRANKAAISISVTDKGIGISEQDQEHLFSSFFRGHNAQNIQGTGLGLHIVKRYLNLLGGSIDLESELNKGTTFTITLPNQPQMI